MVLLRLVFGAITISLASVGTVLEAGTTGSIYDMSRMLQEVHPFTNTPTAPRLLFSKSFARPSIEQSVSSKKIVKSFPKSKAVKTIAQRREEEPLKAKESIKWPPKALSEIRIGLMVHDQGPFSRNKEDGIDANFELLFNSLDFMDIVFSLKPHIGGSVNSSGNTNQAYMGLTWGKDFFRDIFLNFSFGGAYHTGEIETSDPKKKSLGSSFLFRGALDLGYRISGPHSVMFHLNHISNGKLRRPNEGLEAFGVRYGYQF